MGLFVSLLLLTFGCFGVSEVHEVVRLPFLADLIATVIAFICNGPLWVFSSISSPMGALCRAGPGC